MQMDPSQPLNSFSSSFHHDDEEGDERSEPSINDLQRCKAMETIEEAWEETNYSLRLRQTRIDGFTAHFLLQKWEALCMQRKTYGVTDKTIRRVVLDRCVLDGVQALEVMTIFLNKIGAELKELAIISSYSQDDSAYHNRQSLSSLLCGLEGVDSLENLVIERVDLRGYEIGYQLRCVLARNANLEALQLFGSIIDDSFFDQLLIALKYHHGLHFLDFGALGLNDQQFERLVDALVCSSSYKGLQYLDISGSWIGENALKDLTRLFQECQMLGEVILCSCDNLFDHVNIQSPFFRDFVVAINANENIKSIRISHVKLYTPLFRALENETKVRIIHDMQSSFFSTVPNALLASSGIRYPQSQPCTNAILLSNCILDSIFPFSLCSG